MGKYDMRHKRQISSLCRLEGTYQKYPMTKTIKYFLPKVNFTNSTPKYTLSSITTTLCHVIIPIPKVFIKIQPLRTACAYFQENKLKYTNRISFKPQKIISKQTPITLNYCIYIASIIPVLYSTTPHICPQSLT